MDAQEVADAFGLGRASSLSEPVARGELGEIRRLETESGAWAVKQEFEPWDAEADVPDAEQGGAFHLACWQAGIPTPRPMLTPGGRFSAQVAGEAVRVYTWVDIADPDTGLDPALVGELLAGMHSVHAPALGPVHEWFEAPIGSREWKGVLEATRAAGAPYADRLARLLPALLEIESILTPMERVQTCHLDLWSDNLRRTIDSEDNGWDDGLCVIDFDNCGPADPGREVAMLVFEFGRRDAARERLLYDAYREAGGPGRITGRDSFAMTVSQLHHIGHRHLTMWVAARDAVARARSQAGVEEFLGEPLLLSDVDRMLDALL